MHGVTIVLSGTFSVTLTLCIICLVSCTTVSSEMETGFLNRTISIEGTDYPYVIYLPKNYNPGQPWPVLLFLHGAGERGTDGLRQTQIGIGEAVRWESARAKMIVVMPQAPPDQRWLEGPARAAMAALDRTIRDFRGDSSRLYLTGMSMGGYGTYALAFDYPEKFAAIAPVCGGLLPHPNAKSVRQLPATLGSSDPYAMVAARLREIPIWIFHGERDDIVPPSEGRSMHQALRAAGATVRYTEYPDVGHAAWLPAYGSEEFWSWLLAQKRKSQ